MTDANFVFVALHTPTATNTSAITDLKTCTSREGYHAKITVNSVSGTSPTLVVKAQHSSDSSTFEDFAVDQSIGSITAAGVYWIELKTPLRYVRFVETIGGTLPVFALVVEPMYGRPQ